MYVIYNSPYWLWIGKDIFLSSDFIKNNLIVEWIIEIFEKESLNIKVIIELKRVLIKTTVNAIFILKVKRLLL